jgi:hypothetical protein
MVKTSFLMIACRAPPGPAKGSALGTRLRLRLKNPLRTFLERKVLRTPKNFYLASREGPCLTAPAQSAGVKVSLGVSKGGLLFKEAPLWSPKAYFEVVAKSAASFWKQKNLFA